MSSWPGHRRVSRQHMYQKYGRDRAAMVANVVRYRTRSAIREVGKVFGIPEIVLDHCAKLLPHWDGNLEAVFTEAGLDLPELLLGTHGRADQGDRGLSHGTCPSTRAAFSWEAIRWIPSSP